MATVFYNLMPAPTAIDVLNRLWERVAGVHSMTDGATIIVDITNDQRVYDVTLNGNRTFVGEGAGGVALGHSSLADYDGKLIVLRLRQGAAGTYTATLSTGFHYGSAFSSITIATGAGKVTYIGTTYDHANSRLDVISYSAGF